MEPTQCPVCDSPAVSEPGKIELSGNTYQLAFVYTCSQCNEWRCVLPNRSDRRYYSVFTDRPLGLADPQSE